MLTPVDYLLSQNHTNEIILRDFDFQDEEVIGYYIAFLKVLSFRVNKDTINFFYDEVSYSPVGSVYSVSRKSQVFPYTNVLLCSSITLRQWSE